MFSDCDDTNPNVNPDSLESRKAGTCDDGIDNDCDGLVDQEDEGCAIVVCFVGSVMR